MQDIHEIDDLKLKIRDLAVRRLWNKLSQTRHNFQGLDQGRDEAICAEMGKRYKDKHLLWDCPGLAARTSEEMKIHKNEKT